MCCIAPGDKQIEVKKQIKLGTEVWFAAKDNAKVPHEKRFDVFNALEKNFHELT